MKNAIRISTVLLLLTSSIVHSQNYVPFPEENAFWTVLEFNYLNGGYDVVVYTVKGDTTVNENQFKKVFRLTEIPNSEDTLWTLHCLMRQETGKKKIFFVRLYQGETQEKLGYDFDVNIGDTISLPAFDYANIGDSIYLIVNPVFDSTQLWNGESRKNYFFASIMQYGSFDLQVIEGVGEWKSPFPNLFYWDAFHQPEMNCLEVNGEYLYGFTADPSENCGFDFLGVNEVPDEPKIRVYPNPANKILHVESSISKGEKTDVRIFNSIGKEVFFGSFQKSNEGKIIIDISDYPSGIYFVVFNLADDMVSRTMIVGH
ncbi:MAG: T9SS type A sorting domain-containing protein [Chlorobi bacterium]|nr:T9SS type A sorting domain-containing protein [Chlorobiota bacterium]